MAATSVPSVIQIHGAWSSSAMMPKLKSQFVFAPDLVGHGSRGGQSLRWVSFSTYVDQMEEILGDHPSAILVGHSMGGLIAQAVAARYPDKVAGLILLASSPPKGIKFPSDARYFKPWYLWPLLMGRPYGIKKPEQRHFFGDLPEGLRLSLESGRASWEVLHGIPVDRTAMRCPVAVLGGKQDRALPVTTQEEIAEFYDVEAEFFDGGHFFHLTNSAVRARIDELICDWGNG